MQPDRKLLVAELLAMVCSTVPERSRLECGNFQVPTLAFPGPSPANLSIEESKFE